MFATRTPVVCVDGSINVGNGFGGASEITCKDYVQSQASIAANAPLTDPQDFNGYAGINVDVVSGLYPGGFPLTLPVPTGTAWSGFVVVPSPAVGGIDAVGCQRGGFIYSFVNGVATPRAVARQWCGMAISASGMVVAITADSLVFGSTDYVTWTPIAVTAPPAGAAHNMNGVVSVYDPSGASSKWLITCSGVVTTTQFYYLTFTNFGSAPALVTVPTTAPLIKPYACRGSANVYYLSFRAVPNGAQGYTCVRTDTAGVTAYSNVNVLVADSAVDIAASPSGSTVVMSSTTVMQDVSLGSPVLDVKASFDSGATFIDYGDIGVDRFAFLSESLLIGAYSLGGDLRAFPNAGSASTFLTGVVGNSHSGSTIKCDLLAWGYVSSGYKTSGVTVYYTSAANGILRSVAADNLLKVIGNAGPVVLGDAQAGTLGATGLSIYGAGNPAAATLGVSPSGVGSTGLLTLAGSGISLADSNNGYGIQLESVNSSNPGNGQIYCNTSGTFSVASRQITMNASGGNTQLSNPNFLTYIQSGKGVEIAAATISPYNSLVVDGGNSAFHGTVGVDGVLTAGSVSTPVVNTPAVTGTTALTLQTTSVPLTIQTLGTAAGPLTLQTNRGALTISGYSNLIQSTLGTSIQGSVLRQADGASTYVKQPMIQCGTATGTTGTVTVNLTTAGGAPYASASAYIVQVTMGDAPTSSLYVNRIDGNTFTIGYTGTGTHTLFWTTYSLNI